MKKIIYSFLLVMILLTLNGCSNSDGKTATNTTQDTNKTVTDNIKQNNKTLIDSNKTIIELTIRVTPMGGTTFIKDKNQIEEIIDYINTLDLKPTNDSEKYDGKSYIITVDFDDKTSTKYYLDAGRFFHKDNEDKYLISHEQFEKFLNIYDNLSSK